MRFEDPSDKSRSRRTEGDADGRAISACLEGKDRHFNSWCDSLPNNDLVYTGEVGHRSSTGGRNLCRQCLSARSRRGRKVCNACCRLSSNHDLKSCQPDVLFRATGNSEHRRGSLPRLHRDWHRSWIREHEFQQGWPAEAGEWADRSP